VRGKCATVQTVLMRQVGGKEVQTETWDYKGSITMEVGVEVEVEVVDSEVTCGVLIECVDEGRLS
jgi:hypothetical protein